MLNMHKCSACLVDKPRYEFYESEKRLARCRDCWREYYREDYQRNQDKLKERSRQNMKKRWDSLSVDQKAEVSKLHRPYQKEWQNRNRDKRNAQGRARYCPEKRRLKAAKHKLKYPNAGGDYYRRIKAENPEKVRAYHREYLRTRRNDASFRIASNLRRRICGFVRHGSKSAAVLKLLGCSHEEFRIHLQSQFSGKMHWNNYGSGEGKWSIDHIIPCSAYDLTKESHQRHCFFYMNMRPLWDVDNKKKRAFVTDEQRQIVASLI